MEISVDLDEDVVDELDEEARLQGFDSRDAYLRWIVAHRPMSELGTAEAPALASRVSELEERVKLLERQNELDEPVDPDADLGDASSTSTGDLESDGPGEGGFVNASPTGSSTSGTADSDEEEAEAADDDIAEAIGDVSLDDEE